MNCVCVKGGLKRGGRGFPVQFIPTRRISVVFCTIRTHVNERGQRFSDLIHKYEVDCRLILILSISLTHVYEYMNGVGGS